MSTEKHEALAHFVSDAPFDPYSIDAYEVTNQRYADGLN